MLIAQGQVLDGTESLRSRAQRIATVHKKEIAIGVAVGVNVLLLGAAGFTRRKKRKALD